MDFEDDIRRDIAKWLAKRGHCDEGDLRTLAMRFLNIKRRVLPMVRWTLHVSKELETTELPEKIQAGLQYFQDQASQGKDLTPFLHDKILQDDYRDLLLYDWAIYHFHLGVTLDERGFVERTDELLFAIADLETDSMYFVDIYPHKGAFTNQDLLRIIEENWPSLLERYSWGGVTPIFPSPTGDDLRRLRESGVGVVLVTPGGRTLVPPGGGVSAAKTSVQDTLATNRSIFEIRRLQEEVESCFSAIAEYFEHAHCLLAQEVSPHATISDGVITIIEGVTGVIIREEPGGWRLPEIGNT